MHRTADAASAARATPQHGTSSAEQAGEQPKPRLLLAEDSPANQLVAASRLRHVGYLVDIADNGEQALAALAEHHYDLVLMDMRMPVMDGLTATREIRRLAAPTCSVPIIALTAEVMPEELQRCIECGMQDYVTKPVDFKLLKQKILYWLDVGESANPATEPQATPDGQLDETTLSKLEAELPAQVIPRMVAVVIAETRDRLAALTVLLEASDLDGVGDQAHALKGSAASFGLSQLSAMAKSLEQASRAGEQSQVLKESLRAMQAQAEPMLQQLHQRYPPPTEKG